MNRPNSRQPSPGVARLPARLRYGVHLLVILGSACSSLASSSAFASDCRAPIQILYDAPKGCPSTARLTEQLISRASNLVIADDRLAERVYSVTIIRQPTGFEGVLMVHSDQRHLVESRRIARTACDDVVSALALVVAMIPPPPTRCWRLGHIGLALPAVRTGAPRPGVAFSAFLAVRRIHAPGTTIDGRLTLTRASIESPVMGRRLALDWLTIALDVAVIHKQLLGSMYGALWTGVEIGALRGTTSPRDGTPVIWRPWVAPIAGARTRWSPPGRFFVELDAGVGWPVIRDRFHVEPGVEIHRIPAFIASATLALGVAF